MAILEVCYALGGDFDTWLDDLVNALQPSLDVGLGLVCTGVRLTSSGPQHAFETTWGNAPGNAGELIRISQQTMPDPSEVMATFASSRFTTARGEMSEENLQRFNEIASTVGVRDGAGVVFSDGTLGVLIAALLPHKARLAIAERRMWSRIAIHLSHALRLRRRITGPPVAVLAPNGRMLHAEQDALPLPARELLRAHVKQVERARSRTRRADAPSAVALWKGLVDGRWSLVDRFESDGKRFIVALENPIGTPPIAQLSPKERAVCQLAAEGYPNTSIAYALGSKPSTVGNQLSRALQKLRLAKRSDLVRTWGLLARGDTQVSPLPEVDDALVVARGAQASRPLPQLTPAEREIATLLAEGWSNSDIARHRGVSPRTVANQVQRIFDKLGVSSRVAVQNAIERG